MSSRCRSTSPFGRSSPGPSSRNCTAVPCCAAVYVVVTVVTGCRSLTGELCQSEAQLLNFPWAKTRSKHSANLSKICPMPHRICLNLNLLQEPVDQERTACSLYRNHNWISRCLALESKQPGVNRRTCTGKTSTEIDVRSAQHDTSHHQQLHSQNKSKLLFSRRVS